jgi:hypothetical protein
MLQHFNFKHDEEDIVDALGLQQRDYRVAKMTIKYEFLAPLVLAADDETIMKVTTESVLTRSQILEKTLKRLEGNISQQMLAIFLYNDTYNSTKSSIKTFVEKFKDFSEMNSDEMGHQVNAENISDALKQIEILMAIKPLMASVEFLNKSKCNYSKFIAFTVDDVSFKDALAGKTTPTKGETEESSDDNKYSEIDEIIKKAFEDSEDE